MNIVVQSLYTGILGGSTCHHCLDHHEIMTILELFFMYIMKCWCIKDMAVHRSRQQWLVIKWLWSSVTVRVRLGLGLGLGSGNGPSFFFCCLC